MFRTLTRLAGEAVLDLALLGEFDPLPRVTFFNKNFFMLFSLKQIFKIKKVRLFPCMTNFILVRTTESAIRY